MEEGGAAQSRGELKMHPHPGVEGLSFLLGSWKGHGEGVFPTINSFNYSEHLLFTPSPNKPVIAYSQKTWNLVSNQPMPMHSESGYWRPKPDGTIEVVIAQSTGLVEVLKGSYDAKEKTVNLKSELVGNASKVKETTRSFRVLDGELNYVVEMATHSVGLQKHLQASLKKL